MVSLVTSPFAPSAHCPTVSSMPATHPLSASPSASRMMSLVLVVDHEREFRIGLDTGGSLGVRSVSGAAGDGFLLKARAPLRRLAGSGVMRR